MNFLTFVNILCCLIFLTVWNMSASVASFDIRNEPTHPCSKRFYSVLWSYTVDLLKNLKKDQSEENVLVSPISTYIALSMLHLGAGERTQKELSKILKLSEDEKSNELKTSNLHTTLTHIKNGFKIQRETFPWESISRAELANGIFVQKDFPIEDSYIKQLENYYNGSATNVDYQKGNEATDLINKWISEKTLNRIPKFFGEPIDPETVASLISTLYFEGKWKNTFENSSTKIEKFNTGSTEIEVSMMRNEDNVLYESIPSLQSEVITLPYAGGDFLMNIFLPYRTQSLKNLTNHLHLLNMDDFGKKSQVKRVDYKIPKMKFNWKKSLVEVLNVRSIFNHPDLSKLTPKSVRVSDMLHATEIEVDEWGTKASAVTSIQIMPSSVFVPFVEPIKFYVDRPFFLNILHIPSCSILFSGLVHKPIQ